jgi:hypothetical protein
VICYKVTSSCHSAAICWWVFFYQNAISQSVNSHIWSYIYLWNMCLHQVVLKYFRLRDWNKWMCTTYWGIGLCCSVIKNSHTCIVNEMWLIIERNIIILQYRKHTIEIHYDQLVLLTIFIRCMWCIMWCRVTKVPLVYYKHSEPI